jgi:hypothetical protein
MSRELKMYRNTVLTVDIVSICHVCSRYFCVRLHVHSNAVKQNKTTIFAGLTPCILVSICQNARRRMLRDRNINTPRCEIPGPIGMKMGFVFGVICVVQISYVQYTNTKGFAVRTVTKRTGIA